MAKRIKELFGLHAQQIKRMLDIMSSNTLAQCWANKDKKKITKRDKFI